jgi:phosphoglycolate phosphatase-like HAD superfamily hydrolase
LKQLLLFDIDGTLVDTAGAGLAALHNGLRDAFPDLCQEPLPALDLRGATDAGVIRQLFVDCGIELNPTNQARFTSAYLACLQAGLSSPTGSREPVLLPGVAGLLQRLAVHPDQFSLGLLTGNMEEGAFTKLRHFQIDRYFRFGAYGLDREHRDELGPIALERAHAFTGRKFSGRETVIIGDTPRDIQCAQAFGARCLAVATGGFAIDALTPHGADAVLPDLTAADSILDLLATWSAA